MDVYFSFFSWHQQTATRAVYFPCARNSYKLATITINELETKIKIKKNE